MNPNLYLLLLLTAIVVALASNGAASMVRASKLRVGARQLGLQFSHPDRFRLGRRVAARLPVTGAAEVSVRDVAYRRTDAGLLCVMTARFTVGAVGHRRHERRACAAFDPGNERPLEAFEMLPDKSITADAYAHAFRKLEQRTARTA